VWIKVGVVGISREKAIALIPNMKEMWISYAQRVGISSDGYPHSRKMWKTYPHSLCITYPCYKVNEKHVDSVDKLSPGTVDNSGWVKWIMETLGVLHNFAELSTFFGNLSTYFTFLHTKRRIKSCNCSDLSL
jgi:hypothetical protein